jgi:predicted GTPase
VHRAACAGKRSILTSHAIIIEEIKAILLVQNPWHLDALADELMEEQLPIRIDHVDDLEEVRWLR